MNSTIAPIDDQIEPAVPADADAPESDETPAPRTPRPRTAADILISLAEGVRFVARTPLIALCVFSVGVVFGVAMNFNVIIPPLARLTLQIGAPGLGALMAAIGLGSLTGALTVAVLREPRRLMIVVGGRAIVAGTMTLGDLISYIFFTGLMAAPIVQIASIGTQISEAFAGLDRIREILETTREDAEDAMRVSVTDLQGRVEFDHVWFEYNPGVEVLKHITFSAPAGTTTAAFRTTANAVCAVVEGTGSSEIGAANFAWGPRDVFSVPYTTRTISPTVMRRRSRARR